MTVASTLNKKHYQGNNLTTEFPLPFHVTAKEHIFALLKKGTKIEEIKTNFTVDLERKMFIYPVHGEAIKTGESLTIYRKIPLTQIVDLENAGAFHPEVLEYDGFDRIVMQLQQIDEEISRALKIDITDMRDTSHLLEELFAAREEAVLSAKKALEQAKIAGDKAEMTKDWAQFAEEKVKELTGLEVECFISNDGQGQVTYDKDAHKLEIVLPFDNAGASLSKMVLTDSTELARSDIGASAKAVQSLQAKMYEEMANAHAVLDIKIDKSAISSALDSESEETVASSNAVNELRKQIPNLAMPSEEYIDISAAFYPNNWTKDTKPWTAPANGFIFVHSTSSDSSKIITGVHQAIILNSEGVQVYADMLSTNSIMDLDTASFIPIKKGNQFKLVVKNDISVTATIRFYYAEGEI